MAPRYVNALRTGGSAVTSVRPVSTRSVDMARDALAPSDQHVEESNYSYIAAARRETMIHAAIDLGRAFLLHSPAGVGGLPSHDGLPHETKLEDALTRVGVIARTMRGRDGRRIQMLLAGILDNNLSERACAGRCFKFAMELEGALGAAAFHLVVLLHLNGDSAGAVSLARRILKRGASPALRRRALRWLLERCNERDAEEARNCYSSMATRAAREYGPRVLILGRGSRYDEPIERAMIAFEWLLLDAGQGYRCGPFYSIHAVNILLKIDDPAARLALKPRVAAWLGAPKTGGSGSHPDTAPMRIITDPLHRWIGVGSEN